MMWTLLLNMAVAAVVADLVVIVIRRFFNKSTNFADRIVRPCSACEDADSELDGSATDCEESYEDEDEEPSLNSLEDSEEEQIIDHVVDEESLQLEKDTIEKEEDANLSLLFNGGAGDFVQYVPMEMESHGKKSHLDPEEAVKEYPVQSKVTVKKEDAAKPAAQPMDDVFYQSTFNGNALDSLLSNSTKKKKNKKKKKTTQEAMKSPVSSENGAPSPSSNATKGKKKQNNKPAKLRKRRRRGKKIRFEGPAVGKAELAMRMLSNTKGQDLPAMKVAFWRVLGRQAEEDRHKKTPNMWDYDPNTLPAEFVNKKKDTYLVNPNGLKNLCLLPKDILVRICSMLHPLDFVELSLACRILHWKMFTFCTCYAPYTVRMEIVDREIHQGIEKFKIVPSAFGNCKKQPRGLFVLQPKCLKRPFVFDTLELSMGMNSAMTDLALERIPPIRQHANRLQVIYFVQFNGYKPTNLHEPDRFFEKLKVNTFRVWFHSTKPAVHSFLSGADAQLMTELWSSVKAVRELDEVCIAYPRKLFSIPTLLPLNNRIGIYGSPPDKELGHAFENFVIGKDPCEFHAYVDLPHNHKYLQVVYSGFHAGIEEYYSDRVGYFWLEEMTPRNGSFTMKVYRKEDGTATILFGRTKTFYKYQRQFHRLRRTAGRNPIEDDSDGEEDSYPEDYDDDLAHGCWKLDTALAKP